jgi:two-component system, cell cycle sensor histidine kinase and response regulator CckA
MLVVEDNPITRRMMRFALEAEGFRVVEAGDGQTALAAAAQAAPDLVLQDYVLPDMDGIQLIESLRLLPGMAETPVLVVTGLVSQIDALRRQALENTTFLPKPIEPSRLLDVVRAVLSGRSGTQGAGRRLLVVDDEPLNLKLAAFRLQDAGFEVDTAGSGEEALEKAGRYVPDAILSDVLMPGMDGFVLCRAIRDDPRLGQIPVVLLSASYVDPADQRLAFDMGANALLLRTSDLEPAIKALGEVFRNQKTSAPLRRAPDVGHGREMTPLHKERVQIQLERQMARNDALMRQGAIQAAALSVVRGLAEALSSPRDLASVLGDVLVHCLDATGVSTGLLYLAEPDGGGFQLRAQAGLPPEARPDAAACFGHPEILRRCLDGGIPLAFTVSAAVSDPALRGFAERLGRASAMIIPFVVAKEPVGLLLLAANAQDFSEPAWLGFARTLAVQFGQTIAVGQSLTRGASSQARYQTIMEHANDAILLLDEHGIVEANRQAEVLLGRPRAEMAGRPYQELVVADESSVAPIVFGASTTRMADQLLRRADGSTVAVDVSASPVHIGDETIVVLILRDITERKRAELRLQESEEQYRLLFDSNPHPMWVYEPDNLAFLAVNDAAVQLYGYSREEFLRMNIRDIRPPEDIPALLERIAARDRGEPATGVFRHRLKTGAIIEVEVAANSLLFRGRPARLVLVNDVSDKRRLEAQLLQAQKMEAVGRLAGGVAHDFNNLLGVITGYSELLGKTLEPQHRGWGRLLEIQKAAERAAGLTRQLLAFSRKQVLATRVLDLNHIVGELEKMLRRLIGEDVQLLSKTAVGLWPVRADSGQIEQVIVNLVVNARDAMPNGGTVVVETSNVLVDDSYARSHADVSLGAYVMLTVSDTGEGMDEATQSHIFEPFFTTKEEGKGTGLGLATVFGIVKQSGGHIRVYSEKGVGSTFKVYLPRAYEAAEAETAAEPAKPLRGTETILLVEDAEALRIMIREILEGAGYGVIECADAAEALRKPAPDVARAHLLLTDVIMPQTSGPDVARSLRQKHPGLKVLFMSGYTNQAIGHHGVLDEGAQLLEKPFTTEGLLRKVRSVLDAG